MIKIKVYYDVQNGHAVHSYNVYFLGILVHSLSITGLTDNQAYKLFGDKVEDLRYAYRKKQ